MHFVRGLPVAQTQAIGHAAVGTVMTRRPQVSPGYQLVKEGETSQLN